MKTKYIKQLFSAALIAVLSSGVTSCINDLDISPIDPQTGSSFDQQGVFVKGYAMLGVTGQKGIDGSPDLDGQDEGESGFYRTTFNCNELPTDECLWAWQENQDIPQLTSISWSPSSQRTEWVYVRLGYDITQYNFFLDQTEGMTDAETLRQRAEIRFLRALHYWYFLDLFGKAPFKEHFNNDLPVEKKGTELYTYIQNELNEIEGDMYEPRQAPFGRADKAANWLLRARLYLNAGVYTGQTDYAKAEEYASKVIGSAYKLCTNYSELFMADNDENENAMQEIILPIRQDGVKTRNYGGSTYLVCGTRVAGMPRMGTTNGWSCIFARATMVQKFFSNLDDVPMLPCLFTFIQMIGHNTGRAGGSDHGDIHALLQGFYAGPPSGSFLFCAVFDAVNELPVPQVVGLTEDTGSNANQVAVKLPFVPGFKDMSQLLIVESAHIF